MMKLVVASCSPLVMMLGRMSVASLVFLIFWKRYGKIEYRRGDWKLLGFMALCEPCLYFTFESHALRCTSASEAATITALLPLMTMVAARFTLGERISLKALVGLGLAVSGVAGLTAFSRTSDAAPCPLLGNTLELVAMLCATGYTISSRYLSTRYSAFFLTAVQAFVGSVFFLPAVLVTGSQVSVVWTWPTVLAIIYLGALVNVLAYFLYNYGLSRIPASQASPYVNLIPVFSMLLAWLILDEQLTSPQYLSVTLLLAGTFAGRNTAAQYRVLDVS